MLFVLTQFQVECLASLRRWQNTEVKFLKPDGKNPFDWGAFVRAGLIEADLVRADGKPTREAIIEALLPLVNRGYLERYEHNIGMILGSIVFLGAYGQCVEIRQLPDEKRRLAQEGSETASNAYEVLIDGEPVIRHVESYPNELSFRLTPAGFVWLDGLAPTKGGTGAGKRTAGDSAKDEIPLPPARHGEDFRSVHWYGTAFEFTATQAACVRVLWKAMENGTPDVGDETTIDKSGSALNKPKLSIVFRGNPAWGTLIVEGAKKGTHRIAEPPKN